jgi:hypothetical protein
VCGDVTLSVTAFTGDGGTLSYQWYSGDTPILALAFHLGMLYDG